MPPTPTRPSIEYRPSSASLSIRLSVDLRSFHAHQQDRNVILPARLQGAALGYSLHQRKDLPQYLCNISSSDIILVRPSVLSSKMSIFDLAAVTPAR